MKTTYYDRAIELFNGGQKNKTEISKLISKEFRIEHNDTLRKGISTYIKNRALYAECNEVGIDPESVNYYWYKGKKFSINASNKVDLNQFQSDLIEEVKTWAPNYKKIKREKIKDGHCLVFDPADIHIGKLCSSFETGEDYNSQIAVQRVKEGLQGILNKSSGFNIDKIIFITGNDILHIDNP